MRNDPPSEADMTSSERDSEDLRESRRLAALERYDVLDTPKEESFERITQVVQKVFGVPIAFIALLDGHRQWFKACQGLSSAETPRDQAFCNYTIQLDRPLVIEDAAKDARFARNGLVLGAPHIRFYAGVPLRDADGYALGTLCLIDTKPRSFGPDQIELLWDMGRLASDELELRLLATKDGLTGAATRRAFKEHADRAVRLATRHGQNLSCLVLDIDHFKTVNDTFGHSSGDLVLARTVKTCLSKLRDTDVLGRMGGEEFAILLPETDAAGALEVAEKLRAEIASLLFVLNGREVQITASFGAALLPRGTGDLDSLLKLADKALYEAKEGGRNKCVLSRNAETATAPARRRTLKAGRILFNRRNSTMDCTVRSLSDDGAGIDVSNTIDIPQQFELSIKAEGQDKRCKVLSRTEKHLEVAFC